LFDISTHVNIKTVTVSVY